MQFKSFKQPFSWMIMIFVASFLAYLYLRFNDKFYNMPIGKLQMYILFTLKNYG